MLLTISIETLKNNMDVHVDVNIDAINFKAGIYLVLKYIKPEWKENDVIFNLSPLTLAKGVVNTMIKCHNVNNADDAIMFRLKNENMETFIADRTAEARFIKFLNAKDCAPKILSTFKNGFCYEFIVGEVLDQMRIRENPIWKHIATVLAKFHSSGEKSPGEPKIWNGIEGLWAAYPSEIADEKLNKEFKTKLMSREELKIEMKQLSQECKDLNSPTVLCHIDTRGENIIYNKNGNKVMFVDFENMDYYPQAAELAHHFGKYCGADPPDYSLMPSEEFQLKWLQFYLQRYYEFTGRSPSDVSERDVQLLYFQVAKYHLFLLLMSALYGPVVMANNPKHPVNMIRFAVLSINEYHRIKDHVNSLKFPAEKE